MHLSPLLLTTVGIVIVLWLLNLLCSRYKFRKMIDKLPGPVMNPIFGFSFEMLKQTKADRGTWFENVCYQYKEGIVRVWYGMEAAVYIRKPEYLEVIMRSTTLITKANIFKFLKPWLGDGIVSSTGQKWVHHRKLLTPAFHFSILYEFSEIMSKNAEIFSEQIGKLYKKDPKKAIDVFPLSLQCALDIICETAMGISINAQCNDESEYAEALHQIPKLAMDRVVSPWLHSDFIYHQVPARKKFQSAVDVLHKFSKNILSKRIEQRKNKINSIEKNEDNDSGTRKKKALLDLLLDENDKAEYPMSESELREQIDTFTFAGHDTTSATVAWSLFCLGNEPAVHENVDKELRKVFGDSKEPVTLDDVANLNYLERVIKEALRRYPTVPAVFRKLTEDVKLDDYVIPKGCTVGLVISQTHRDPQVWKDPLKFDPDRFLPENLKDRHPYAFVPFSAGPRNCIGQKFAMLETKIILATILRKWSVKSVLKYSEMKVSYEFILKPQQGIYLYFVPK